MFYSFAYTLTASDLAAAPHELEINLTRGIIHQVDVLFQSGCAHKNLVQIFHGNVQVWPSNFGAAIKGDATVISFREFYELSAQMNDMMIKWWTTDASVLYEVIVNIGLLPKRIIQPLSFEELLKAAVGT